ncbi:rhomboid-related protein 4 isoform X2 [Octopus bimaculoides]|uniref:rhomboid-related protein 4 isoform X2 n=1 Tax=Octopus bimaculoides TaxID=37653 RepID=UPI00071DA23B|nr:rhomboid-related protein 4 isoform X2 [Octopus bimaculoides]|eukprot:XP_014785439.1 PREDICTED: rhomboid-related protein 4-like isoform X2 [Octopus bimaculoides]
MKQTIASYLPFNSCHDLRNYFGSVCLIDHLAIELTSFGLRTNRHITYTSFPIFPVIFAIKVVLNYMNPQEQHAYGGFLIPYKYIHWLEVVMIQLIVPQASFLGHISGIIVGLIYCKTPLKDIFSRIFPPDQRSESEQENTYSGNRYNQYPGYQPHYDAYQSPYTPYGFRQRRF